MKVKIRADLFQTLNSRTFLRPHVPTLVLPEVLLTNPRNVLVIVVLCRYHIYSCTTHGLV